MAVGVSDAKQWAVIDGRAKTASLWVIHAACAPADGSSPALGDVPPRILPLPSLREAEATLDRIAAGKKEDAEWAK